MRSLLASVVAGFTLLAAGCGGGSSSNVTPSSSTVPDTASLAPKDAGLWASIDTDRSSDQWQALDAVLARIPGAERLLDDALAQAGPGKRKLDFQTDVQPALGKEIVIVLPAGSSDPVVLAKPTNDTKFKALLQDSTTPPVTGEQDGWTVVAQTQKALDAYSTALGRGTLADSKAFAQAMNGLPQVALARAFVDGKGLAAAFGKAAATGSSALKSLPISGIGSAGSSVDAKAIEQLGTIGLAMSAGDHVLRVDGTAANANGVHPVSYAPTLLGKVPADALVAASWNGSAIVASLLQSGLGGTALERQLGVTQADLVAALDGEGVLYLRPSILIPEITLVVSPKDPARAKRVFEDLAAKARQGASGTIAIPGLEPTVSTKGDLVLVSTAKDVATSFGGSGAKLVDSAKFKAAAADVGLGGKTAGFVFVDVKALGPLVKAVLSSTGGSSGDSSLEQLTDALSAIDSLAINASSDGSRTRFQGVVRVG
jgi:hypothetical protein